jgi:hypothetical protein
MGSRFDAVFAGTAEVFDGSKSVERIIPNPSGSLKPLNPGTYKLVVKVAAKITFKIMTGASLTETFEVSWKVVVDDDGKLSFEDRKTSRRVYDGPISTFTLDKFETSGNKAQVGVEVKVEGDTDRRDFEVVLKGNPAPSKAPKKIITYPKVLTIGSFPLNVSEVKKIKEKPSGYADWSGLRKFYDDLPALTKQKIENGEKPGGKPIEVVGLADDSGNAADNSKLGEKRAEDVVDWLKTWSGNRSGSIYLAKGKGSGTTGKGKPDPKKRMATLLIICEEER